MITCKNCKYWKRNDPNDLEANHGSCSLIQHDDPEDNGHIVLYDDCWFAFIETGMDFGCVHAEERLKVFK